MANINIPCEIGTTLYFIVNENDNGECNKKSVRIEESTEWVYVIGKNGEYIEYTKMNDYSFYYIYGQNVFDDPVDAYDALERQKGTI